MEEAIEVIDDVIKNGKIHDRQNNSLAIEKDKYRVVMARDAAGNFVVTSYDNNRGVTEKKRSEADATLFDQRVHEEMDGTLVPSGLIPDDKSNENISDLQEGGTGLERIPRDEQQRYLWEERAQFENDVHMSTEEWEAYNEYMENELVVLDNHFKDYDFSEHYANIAEEFEKEYADGKDIDRSGKGDASGGGNQEDVSVGTLVRGEGLLEEGNSGEVPQRLGNVEEDLLPGAGHGEPLAPEAGGEGETDPTERGSGSVLPVAERRGQGNIQVTQRPDPSDLSQTETEGIDYEYYISDEVDQNGRPFILTSKGDLEFGRIERQSGLAEAPILLSEGIITNPKTKEGYGLIHIEARHGKQIRQNGYANAIEFIEDVANNWEAIMEAKDRNGNPTFRLIAKGKHNNTIMVELSGDGTYWNINTAGIFKTSYGKNAKEVYTRHTTDKPTAESVEASQDSELSGTTESSRMNAPTSEHKVNDFVSDKQENSAESSALSERKLGSEGIGEEGIPSADASARGNEKPGIRRMFQSARWCEERGYLKKGTLEKYRNDSEMLKKICFRALGMESLWLQKQEEK